MGGELRRIRPAGTIETGRTAMSAAAKRKMTPQEYLAFERASETRHEFYQGEVFDMAGASYEHTRVKDNLARHLGNRFENGPCEILSTDLRVKVDATGLYTYPDIIVLCGKPEFEGGEFDILLNPTAIVEILSPTTEKYDRGKKFQHYKRIPSVHEYVLVAQDEMLIDRYVRQPDQSWIVTTFTVP